MANVHPRLKDIDAEIRAANDTLSVLRGKRSEAEFQLVNEALGTDHKPYDLEHCRTWSCPDDMGEPAPAGPSSPTGHCVFLKKEDLHRMNCLFCHGPEERQ